MTASPPADNLPLPPLPDEKFGVISIDIPWHFRSRAPTQNHPISRSHQRHYPTMDLEHAEQKPIKHRATPDAHDFMWITGPLMVTGYPHQSDTRRVGTECGLTCSFRMWPDP